MSIRFFAKMSVDSTRESKLVDADAELTKTTEITAMRVNEEYRALLKLTIDLHANIEDKLSVEHIETLREIEIQLKKFHCTFNSQDAHFDDGIVLAQIYLKLSEIYGKDNKKERLYIAREYAMQCVKLVEGKELDRKVIITAVLAFFSLQNISIQLQNLEEMEQFARKLHKLYWTYTGEKEDYPAPIDVPAVIGIETKGNDETYTIHVMDQTYLYALQSMLYYYYCCSDESSSTEDEDYNIVLITCEHKILKKMLKTSLLPVDYYGWVSFASNLSIEFSKRRRFSEARNHLAVASLVVKKFHDEKYIKIDEKENQERRATICNEFTDISALLAVSWAKYGNTLLRSSAERLLHEEDVTNFATQSPKLLFANLETELQDFTDLIGDTYIVDYKDAKTVFRRVIKWLEEARKHIVSGKHTKIYIELSRNIFKAYKYFAYYEREKDDRIKLYKQRKDTLHDILKSLNVDDNIDARKNILRLLLLASYSLLDIMTEDLEPYDTLNAKLSVEIDKLVKQIVHISETYMYTIGKQ
ncbi:PREDICTED: uncharacterized protein LOC106745014 isoform X2 [Dinoponera quadriceps]|uniref:KIF-binding protein n=1 Tax=Dinoponera quadriceps TaxID=609295 RepID=A0A6P3XCX2_DINQU|nr:PREDICTED: uncharacterized protein LOC106745014 isoform X2 [Dinoponera quadriceps]